MGWAREVKRHYRLPDNAKPREALNRALRAELKAAPLLLDAAMLLTDAADRPPKHWPPQWVAAVRRTASAVGNGLDELRDALIAWHSRPDPDDDSDRSGDEAKKKTRPASVASSASLRSTPPAAEGDAGPVPASHDGTLPSTPPPPGATAAVSLADLSPSSVKYRTPDVAEAPAGAHAWTAAMDDQLGTAPDEVLGKRWGRSGEAVRRRRASLGVPAHKPKAAWTEERLRVLDEEPDNAKAAARLGVSVNAVKVARSRFGRPSGECST